MRFQFVQKCWSMYRRIFLCDIEGDDIQQMKSEIEASNIAGMTQEAFSVSEVLEISSGKQAAETIIRSDCSITMDDMKVLDNKLILQEKSLSKFCILPVWEKRCRNIWSIPFRTVK